MTEPPVIQITPPPVIPRQRRTARGRWVPLVVAGGVALLVGMATANHL